MERTLDRRTLVPSCRSGLNFGRNMRLPGAYLPQTEDELVDLLRARGDRGIVVLGRRGSWSPLLAPSRGDDLAVDLRCMPGSLRIDAARRQATVAGWMEAEALHMALSAAGWQLPHIPTWCHATVAGLCATGSHGASRDTAGIADAVLAMDLLDGDGHRLRLDDAGLRELDTGRMRLCGPQFLEHGRVHLGTLGIVTAVTLRIEPETYLEQTQVVLPAHAALGGGLRAHLADHEHASLAWGVRQGRCVARAADRIDIAPRRASLVSPFEAALTTLTPTVMMRMLSWLPWLADLVMGALMTPWLLRARVSGPAWQVLTYMPARLWPVARLRTMEYFVPFERIDEVVDLYARHLAGGASQMPVNFRRAGPVVCVEHLWCAGFPRATARAQRIEADLVDHLGADALPHLGKLHWINPWPRLPKAQRDAFLALKRAADPRGLFESRYVAWMLSEPSHRRLEAGPQSGRTTSSHVAPSGRRVMVNTV